MRLSTFCIIFIFGVMQLENYNKSKQYLSSFYFQKVILKLSTNWIGLSLRSSPIGARVRNKWGAQPINAVRAGTLRGCSPAPRYVKTK